MILYHFTKKENLQSILNKGLIIDSKIKGLQCRGKRDCIFLTSKKDYINEVVSEKDDYIRLDVDCEGLEIENELDFSKIYKDEIYYPKEHYRFICKSNIDKNRIFYAG